MQNQIRQLNDIINIHKSLIQYLLKNIFNKIIEIFSLIKKPNQKYDIQLNQFNFNESSINRITDLIVENLGIIKTSIENNNLILEKYKINKIFKNDNKSKIKKKEEEKDNQEFPIFKKLLPFSNEDKENVLKKESKNNFPLSKNISISEEEIQLLLKLPKLEDGIQVELRTILELENHVIYYGEFDKNEKKRHGRGIQIWNNGRRYEGYWKQNKKIKGKLIYSNGDIYEGEFLNDKAHGYGIYTYIDGTKYEGNWKNDKKDGKGKEIYPDGAFYDGDYKEGKKIGKGIYKFADGSIYEGEFDDNQINGKGKFIWPDKRQYFGDWKNSKMNGGGIFIWPDGRKYKGQYKNNKKEGYGFFEWPDGKKYRGNWNNGKQDGEGELYNISTKTWMKCLFKEGKRIKWFN